ncbi:MAG: aminoacyl-tRNA hydrolase [Dehalococcoidales bacterium]|nr:MAG: aminoacyl-tRNA hydrolase [Dehalococcoidales bacterium]
MKLIVGLGNPGRRYEKSRHNLGFICINRLARESNIKLNKNQGRARTGKGSINGNEVLLARPQTYMNLSGESVKLLLNNTHTGIEDLIVIHDDLDLPVGKIRVRFGGGSGGHKGINSIFQETGSRDFNRVRIGIGRPLRFKDYVEIQEDDVIDYVLSDFTRDEKKVIEKTIPLASEAVVSLVTEGLTATMNRYNSNSIINE